MTRMPRQLSSTGYYHIIFRGVNHCHLFEEDEDYEKFLKLLEAAKSDLGFEVCAYCLMSNHGHLLVSEKQPGDIMTAMRKVLGPYANWFNRKYKRSGSLIANRYKSSPVETDAYLLTLVRYIHQNPLMAGISKHIDKYRYSSYRAYTKGRPTLVCTNAVLSLFSIDSDKAIEDFIEFHKTAEQADYTLPDGVRKTEQQIRDAMVSVLGETKPTEICSLPLKERNAHLSLLRKKGFSIRQIERATGISKKIIERV